MDEEGVPETLKILAGILWRHGWTVSTAESCTGGLFAHMLTNISGSSRYFDRGFITYSNEAKIQHLGVAEQTLKDHGAVSAEVAREMVVGLQKLAGTDISISITGIAGPTGGTEQKPVGLVYIGYNILGDVSTEEYIFPVGRIPFKHRVVETALMGIYSRLEEHIK